MSSTSHPFKNNSELNGIYLNFKRHLLNTITVNFLFNNFLAFLRVYETIKSRIPATVWLFESGDFHVLCDKDITFSDESVPAGDDIDD